MLRDRSLLFKLTASGFLVIAALGLLWFCSGWYFLSEANDAAEIRDLGDQVYIDMLQVRRWEKNFILRDLNEDAYYDGAGFNTPSLVKHQDRVAVLKSDVSRLKELLPDARKSIAVDLLTAVDDYNLDFTALVAAYRKLGLQNSGYQGDWRRSIAVIETVLNEHNSEKLQLVLLELRRREKDYLLRGDIVEIGKKSTYSQRVKEQLQTLRDAIPTELPEQSKQLLESVQGYDTAFAAYVTEATAIGRTEDSGLRKGLADAVEQMEPFILDPEVGIRKVAFERELAAKQNLVISQSVILLLGILGAGLLFYSLGRILTAPLASMIVSADAIAQGDLTLEALAEGKDETGRLAVAFNKMVKSLRDVLSQTKRLTGEVATASNQIAAGAQQQLSSLTETATSLNEITTTAEEFKATMQEFADRSRAVQEAADETTKRTAEGRTLTQDSAARIEQVRVNSQTAGASVLKLSEQMQRIGEITATVNEIAEQTKLLALNASIEAARAGEEGRGFAVVATQVRELANQSKESAGRIESLIADTQKSMQNVVTRIEEGSRLSEDSVESVQQMARSFEEISQAISQTREAMSQISTGARQQEAGIVELVSSITEIDSGSRESVASAEQTQKALLAVDQRIKSLNEAVERFKT